MIDVVTRHWRASAAAALLLLIACVLGANVTGAKADTPIAAPAPPSSNRIGFVATYFYYAMYQGADACPAGVLATSIQNSIPRGPHNENLCRMPQAAPETHLPTTLGGNRNDGLNLDGSADDAHTSPYTCAHKQYVGENNEPGIDNQVGRMFACLSGLREHGPLVPYFTQVMHDGMWSFLIDISGVDDVHNDPEVVVDFYAGDDTMVKGPDGHVLAGASIAPKTDPLFHRQAHGHIVNGVLETVEIPDLFIPDIMLTSAFPPIKIEHPRLRLTLLENGEAQGYLGGYILKSHFLSQQAVSPNGLCAPMYYDLTRYADGARDAATGECGAISAAFRIQAVRAFIVHPEHEPIPTFGPNMVTGR